MRARDGFAGCGGWDVAATALGWDVDGIEIMPEARATRDAVGLTTIGSDVRDVTPVPGEYDVDIWSPPCQTFSAAGKGVGRAALDAVLAGVKRYGSGDYPSYDELAALTGDPRTALVLEPLRVALQGRSTYLAWEQVPPVLPVWEACAEVLRAAGYSVATGVLNAEQYGVPQTRRRAILVARRDGHEARLPVPTHSRYYSRDPGKLDQGVLPWVSMAEALGWGMTARPSMTVTGGGAETGGAEPFGTGARKGMEREREAGRWALRGGNQVRATEREETTPSPTLHFGARVNAVEWHFRATNDRPNTTTRPAPAPAPAPAPTLAFGKARPEWTDGTTTRAVTIEEVLALQTFPADYPLQGSKSKRFLQAGNAIPPLLALAVLKAITT